MRIISYLIYEIILLDILLDNSSLLDLCNKRNLQEVIGFRKQDTLVCILYCNSPVLRSIRTPLSPWGLCGMMSYLPISKGLNGSLPSLPYHIPKRQSCGCQQRIAQLLLQHTEGRWEKPSLWNRNKRQLGFKAGGGGVVKWEGTAGCFQASPSPPPLEVETPRQHPLWGLDNCLNLTMGVWGVGEHRDTGRLSQALHCSKWQMPN